METIELTVIQEPTHVTFSCPKCQKEHTYTYSNFCDEFGEPCDWNYNKIKCKGCECIMETYGADW